MDDLHDETSDLHDEAAHVADELASAMATCEGCGNMGYADSWPFVAPFTAVAGGPAVLLCQDCVQARVDNEIADEMVSEFFGEPADGGGQLAPLSEARLAADILRRWFLSNEPIDADRLQEAIALTPARPLTATERMAVRWMQPQTRVSGHFSSARLTPTCPWRPPRPAGDASERRKVRHDGDR